jgi:hypothetical protein
VAQEIIKNELQETATLGSCWLEAKMVAAAMENSIVGIPQD